MFVKKDTRKIRDILVDSQDPRTELQLARRVNEFPNSSIRAVLCRPEQVAALANLVHLSLYGNELTSLGGIEALGACARLETLDVGRNKLSEIPEEIAALSSLKELVADDNLLSTVDAGVLKLSNLSTLRLSGNKIRVVPSGIRELRNLKLLALDNNLIEELPASLGELGELHILSVRQNAIQTLPHSLDNLPLQNLIASSNRLSSFLPGKAVARLAPTLRLLTLNGNRITHLPDEFALLHSCKVNVANNCISIFPATVLAALPEMNTFGQDPSNTRDSSPRPEADNPVMDIEDF